MDELPAVDVASHIEGKNARVRVFPDRVEWERTGKVSAAKMTAAAFTAGASLAATGVRSRKGAGTDMIPMRQVTSVSSRRDSMVNDVVTITASGNAIELRCSKADAARLKQAVLDGIAGRLETRTAPAAPTVSVAPPPPAYPAAWYPDPQVPGQQRYYDGTRWTEHTAPSVPQG